MCALRESKSTLGETAQTVISRHHSDECSGFRDRGLHAIDRCDPGGSSLHENWRPGTAAPSDKDLVRPQNPHYRQSLTGVMPIHGNGL